MKAFEFNGATFGVKGRGPFIEIHRQRRAGYWVLVAEGRTIPNGFAYKFHVGGKRGYLRSLAYEAERALGVRPPK